MAIGITSQYNGVQNNTAPNWWSDAGLRQNVLHILIIYTALFSLGYDAVLLNGVQAIPSWGTYFGKPAGNVLGLISASYFLPKLGMAFIVPPIADKYGRKVTLWAASAFMVAGGIIGGFSINTGQLVGSRVLIGIGTSFGFVGGAAMIPEIAHPRLRGRAGAGFFTCFFIGSILAAWLTFAMTFYPDPKSDNAWRIPFFLQAVGPVILGFGVFLLPPSPRWLIAKGREEQAHAVLAKYHANGVMDDPLVLLELSEIKSGLEVERLANSGHWMTFLSTPADRRRLWIIFVIGLSNQGAGNGVINYYLVPVLRQVGITKPAQTTGINGGLSIWGFVVAISASYLVDRVGRRKLFLISTAGMFAVFVCMTGLSGSYAASGNSAVGVGVVPFIYLYQMTYSIAQTPLPTLYVPEISPLRMRAKSTAALSFFENVMAVFNQFVNPIALGAIGWKYYFVFDALLALYFVAFWFTLRETRGLTTEEAAMVYDTPRAKDVKEHLELNRQAARTEEVYKEDEDMVERA